MVRNKKIKTFSKDMLFDLIRKHSWKKPKTHNFSNMHAFTHINHETRCIAIKFVAEILMNSGNCEQDVLISGKNMYKALPQSFKVI